MQVGKLNPQTPVSASSTSAVGKLNFPGFQEILDFTSAGGEASVSVTVDGDTDKEYLIYTRNTASSYNIYLRLNNDSGNNYGYAGLFNPNGTIYSERVTAYSSMYIAAINNGCTTTRLLTPSGAIKVCVHMKSSWTSGTTINTVAMYGGVWNNTANVTSIDFSMSGGNFNAGTRITVYARRSNV